MSSELVNTMNELQKRLEPTQRVDERVPTTLSGDSRYLKHVPQIKCRGGLEMSVQASEFHYCSPRDSIGPWAKVEIGFPSKRVEAFMPYIDGGPDDDPTGTVYGYVPLDVVAQAIIDHGGFAA